MGHLRRPRWLDRDGAPHHSDQWEWKCGFYPGCDRSTGGPAVAFDEECAAFEAEWQLLLPTLSEANFQAWRNQRDWMARKQAMWERGEKLPSQQPSSLMRCQCGAMFDSHRPTESRVHRQHIYAAQKRMEFADEKRPWSTPRKPRAGSWSTLGK